MRKLPRMDGTRVERLAELIVAVGANVQEGQIVRVSSVLGQEELTRAVAGAAYRRGAMFVDVDYFDPWVKRARILHAAEDTLDFVPSWYGGKLLELGRHKGANISLRGALPVEPLEGLDPERAGRDQLPFIRETNTIIGERSVNWVVAPCPTQTWADLAYPGLPPDRALERLWQEIVHVCRLDEPDPAAAWAARIATLERAAAAVDALRLDAVHFEGPGTDLTIGLFASSRWKMARWQTAWGLAHVPNVPTEEVFTSPDPARADGVVRSTRPLQLVDGAIVRGLEVEFRDGVAVRVEAGEGADVMRARIRLDEGACRLGEVALVDRESRIGQLGTVFYETLLDENAVSHIALGSGFAWAVDDEEERARVNRSMAHVDFMVGETDVAVTGIARDGSRIPLLAGGEWQIEGIAE